MRYHIALYRSQSLCLQPRSYNERKVCTSYGDPEGGSVCGERERERERGKRQVGKKFRLLKRKKDMLQRE